MLEYKENFVKVPSTVQGQFAELQGIRYSDTAEHRADDDGFRLVDPYNLRIAQGLIESRYTLFEAGRLDDDGAPSRPSRENALHVTDEEDL